MQRVFLLAFLVLGPPGCDKTSHKISDEDRAELVALQGAIAAENAKRSSERREALLAAWAGLRPDPSGAPCPIDMPAIDSTDFQVHSAIIEVRMLADSYDLDSDMPRTTGLSEARTDFGEPDNNNARERLMARVALAGPRGRVVSNLENGIERLLEAGTWDDPAARESRLDFFRAYVERFDWELDIVAEENRRPEHNGKVFVGGRVKGRAYVYDYKKGSVVCASEIDATSSSLQVLEIDPRDESVRAHGALDKDLDKRAFEQAVNGLTRAVRAPTGDAAPSPD